MPNYLDDKQRRIITTWLKRSRELTDDPYASFIALWISFNAFCYARYAKNANKRRADLRNGSGLNVLNSEPARAEGTAILEDQRFRLEIETPGRISILISERYTEDIIFSQFARHYQSCYDELLKQPNFEESVKAFRNSLAKNDRWYVINMARSDDYNPKGDYQAMVQRNIIVPFENYKKLTELKNALYQVRCNVFHGEKVPGELNDDRIVKTAYPVLFAIMEALVKTV
jgi:hypothetical protein